MNNASGYGEEVALTEHTSERHSQSHEQEALRAETTSEKASRGHFREAVSTKSTSTREFSETAGGQEEATGRGKIFEI